MDRNASRQWFGLKFIGLGYAGLQPLAYGGWNHLLAHGCRLKGNKQGLNLSEGSSPLDIPTESPPDIEMVPFPLQRMSRLWTEVRKDNLQGPMEPGINFREEGGIQP